MQATAKPETSTTAERTPTKRDVPLVILDASNVAFGGSGGERKARLSLLLEVTSQVPKAGCELKVVADASLRHRIDDKQAYEGFVRAGFILQAPAGRSADQFIAHLARKRLAEGQKVFLLTNDLLRQMPDLEDLRITFLVVSEQEVLFDPPLASLRTLAPATDAPIEPAAPAPFTVVSVEPAS